MKELNSAHPRNEVVRQLKMNYNGTVVFAREFEKLTVLLLEQYYIRTNSNAACLVIVEEIDETNCKVTIKAAGHGEGLLQLSWGSGEDMEMTVYTCVRKLDRKETL